MKLTGDNVVRVDFTDGALYQNKLSIATEDKAAARDTLNKVRAFIASHKTVYLSTHTPLGYENLAGRKVVDLNNMPAPIPPKMDYGEQKSTGKYVCSICGTAYDPAVGDPEHGMLKKYDLTWRLALSGFSLESREQLIGVEDYFKYLCIG